MHVKEFVNILFYKKYINFILFTLIATVVADLFRLLSWVDTISAGYSTYLIAALIYASLILTGYVAFKTNRFNEVPFAVKLTFNAWLIWNIFNILRGGLLANSYWDWKFLMLSSVGFSMISLVFFVGNNPFFVKQIITFFLKYVVVFGFLIIPLTLISNRELYSRLMIPVCFFILFFPYLGTKWKILVSVVVFLSIFIALGFRTNIIKIALSVLLLSLYYFRNYIRKSWLKIAHFLIFVIPLVLLFAGLTGRFNIFAQISTQHEYKVESSQGNEINLTGDTRSFLYKEVLASMDGVSDWVIGKSASGSYNSVWFYNDGGAMNGKRYRCEINVLNILIYHGLIGVVIYLSLIYIVSYRAINNSRNILSKMLGLAIASRWALSFFEEFTQYDLNFYFFWLFVGLLGTTSFRKLSDIEVKKYLRIT